MAFRFDIEEFLARAEDRLLKEVPLEPRRSDDDLNRHLASVVPEDADSRPAAVLVPVVKRRPEVSVLLTQRTDHLPSHPGQVAFPGGKIDDTDEGPVDAALRETQEETGVARHHVRPVGFLDAYQTRTGYRVVPVVAVVEPGFELRPEPGEVAAVFEVPLRFLMTPANHLTHERNYDGQPRRFYAMPYGERYIWGATAGMLRNFYDRLYGS